MSSRLLFMALIFCSTSLYAQVKNSKTAKVVYEARQKIDLEDLSIQGELVAPGDFSIETEKQKASKTLFKRRNFNDQLPMNIEYVY